MSVRKIRAELNTALIGHRIISCSSVGSTNDVARRIAESGAREGTVVLADEQTRGRGRRGRCWTAPAGTSLLFSVILRPSIAPQQYQRLTMACSLATADSIEDRLGLKTGLKWPNDVLIQGKKVAGILTELHTKGEDLIHAVVGVGLNVNVDFTEPQVSFLKEQATSLAQECGSAVSREEVLACVLNHMEARYLALCQGWSPHEEWKSRLADLGRRVAVTDEHRIREGYAEGIDEDGALLLRLADGCLERILAGDTSLTKLGALADGLSSQAVASVSSCTVVSNPN
jgi:BirA family biotin operon repressor/biotin-[acetyl-CoA-carboxylase] ligase